MSELLKVQKGVPLVDIDYAPKAPRRKYPIEGMEPGDMFFVGGGKTKTISAYISRAVRELPGKFSARHCWMRPGAEHEETEWVLASPDVEGAVEGTGVWRIE